MIQLPDQVQHSSSECLSVMPEDLNDDSDSSFLNMKMISWRSDAKGVTESVNDMPENAEKGTHKSIEMTESANEVIESVNEVTESADEGQKK
jgi:hypothetical protein